MEEGYSPELSSMSSLGYREMAAYVRWELPLEDAVSRIKTATHRFGRHQYAWFRPKDPRIHWLHADGNKFVDVSMRIVSDFLRET